MQAMSCHRISPGLCTTLVIIVIMCV
jgi:hypothetical protein